jgi:hypothetical protein
MINGAKLQVTVLIDDDMVDELKKQGCSDKKIEELICKAITLTEINMRQPIESIESVELLKYY